MKEIWILVVCYVYSLNGQITQLPTGTTTPLLGLTSIGNTIFICGNNDYLVRSTNEGSTLTSLNTQAPTSYMNRFQGLSINNLFHLVYTSSQSILYHSFDGGNNWIQKTSTGGALRQEFDFFDSQEGLMYSGSMSFSRTTNGGSTWNQEQLPFNMVMDVIETYGDSMVGVGGISIPNAWGVFYISKDRGHTWSNGKSLGGLGIGPMGFSFISKDTICVVAQNGAFGKTTTGGLNWDFTAKPPINICGGPYFKTSNEGYLLGASSQSIGLVLKTTDFGHTWSTFNTGINTILLRMAILNDSIAILTGTNGTLLRWNYKQSIFTSLDEHKALNIVVYPNPVTDKIYFKNSISSEKFHIAIYNSIGELTIDTDLEVSSFKFEFDLSFLSPGLYYLHATDNGKTTRYKILKK